MANSNRKKARKLQVAKKANAAEREKAAKKVKPAEEKPIKYTITAEQQADGTFEFHGGKGGFNIIKQKNKALEPYGKHYVIYDEVVEGMPGSIRNTVKITGDSMFEVTKNGRSGSRMVFEKDKMNMTNYQTPYGEVLVGIHTRDIQVHVEEENIDVEISYGLDVNEEAVSECQLKVNIRSVG